jgi:hypothetical protein
MNLPSGMKIWYWRRGGGICSRMPEKFVEKFRQGVKVMDKKKSRLFFKGRNIGEKKKNS